MYRGRAARLHAERHCELCISEAERPRLEDTRHIIHQCVWHDDLRTAFPDLFPVGQPSAPLILLSRWSAYPCRCICRCLSCPSWLPVL